MLRKPFIRAWHLILTISDVTRISPTIKFMIVEDTIPIGRLPNAAETKAFATFRIKPKDLGGEVHTVSPAFTFEREHLWIAEVYVVEVIGHSKYC